MKCIGQCEEKYLQVTNRSNTTNWIGLLPGQSHSFLAPKTWCSNESVKIASTDKFNNEKVYCVNREENTAIKPTEWGIVKDTEEDTGDG